MDAVLSVQFDSKRCLTGSADRVLRYYFTHVNVMHQDKCFGENDSYI